MFKSSIVFFDTETTGADIQKDRIVEIAYINIVGGADFGNEVIRLNPEIPISPEATLVHGISDKDVILHKTFKEVANNLYERFKDSYWCAYNGMRFDIPLIQKEFARCGLDIKPKGILDPMRIFNHFDGEVFKKGMRTLMAAHHRYFNCCFDDAHNALSDVQALKRITEAQMNLYPEIRDVEQYSRICTKGNRRLDYRGFFKVVDEKVVVGLGKFQGTPIEQVSAGYLSWLSSNETLPKDARQIAANALNKVYPII